MTVLEAIQRGTEFLTRKGVEAPRLQMELMLAQVLSMPRLKLYLNFERHIEEPLLATLREWTQRRGSREPLQHILGTVSFCGIELAVNRHVLIPRPETEVLAECAWQWLQQRVASGTPAPKALDFGTGSGCLAIALAMRCPQVTVDALEISPEALRTAQVNQARHSLDGRVRFQLGSGLDAFPAESRWDLVVSNPPYIPSADIAGLQPEVRDYDPRGALDGGPDGLDFYRRLALDLLPRMEPEGVFMAEFGDGQADAVSGILSEAGWRVQAIHKDLSGRPRFCVAGVARKN